jgi:hypothetical protein
MPCCRILTRSNTSSDTTQLNQQIGKSECKDQVTCLLDKLSNISFPPHDIMGISYTVSDNDNMNISVLFNNIGRYTNDNINIALSNLSANTKRKLKKLKSLPQNNNLSDNSQIQSNYNTLNVILKIIEQDLKI